MAGSLPGVPLSQQFSAAGKPLAGCLLYIYAANTTTPQDSFVDQGLTVKNPWPLAGDASGRVPMFYLADGSVHVRLTDSGGVVQFDYPSMLVIGPSGGGGGGGGVDPTTVFATGDCIWLEQTGIRTGWVRDNGKTIGNAVSGASERANADCSNLFVYLWTNKSNTECPVSGGRGASALADFNAGKTIQLPDKRGYMPGGDTAMGNADLGNLAGVPFTFGNSSTPGSKGGEATHALLVGEVPNLNLSGTTGLQSVGHTHDTVVQTDAFSPGGRGGISIPLGTASNATYTSGTESANHTHSFSGATTNGGGGAHNNTGLIVIGTYYRKL
jgi:hypothetical protein